MCFTNIQRGRSVLFPDTTCWVPAYFTDNHERYTNDECQARLVEVLLAKNQSAIYSINQSSDGTIQPVSLTDDPFTEASTIVKSMGPSSHTLLRIIITQVILSFALYFISSRVKASADLEFVHQDKQLDLEETEMCINKSHTGVYNDDAVVHLSSSGRPARIYLIVHGMAIVIWLLLALVSLYVSGWLSSTPMDLFFDSAATTYEVSGGFLCDFTIRQMGSVHVHTVQCTFTARAREATVATLATEINASLCVALSLLGLIHVAHFTAERRRAALR